SQILECSKQSVLRMVDDITRVYDVVIQEEIASDRKKYFWLEKQNKRLPALNLSTSEYNLLKMCHAFAEHLMGEQLFEEASRALDKNRALLADNASGSSRHFATIIPGTIDYTHHKEIISTLITAMENSLICKISYKKVFAAKSSTFYIKPLKLFSNKETLYLHARIAPNPAKRLKTFKMSKVNYDPLLAIHRFDKVDLTEIPFEFPRDYDFETIFNENFGVMKEETFEVKAEFTGFASVYVAERIWSDNQTIIKTTKTVDNQEVNAIELTFTASSVPETIAWLLSFGSEAKVLEPDWLVDEMIDQIKNMASQY
ncbi:MAG: WYL domain-containing protein, partial [Desulfamplus sp.]|nr:WYL domain-containing protein [Desulfamplus sp.]